MESESVRGQEAEAGGEPRRPAETEDGCSDRHVPSLQSPGSGEEISSEANWAKQEI